VWIASENHGKERACNNHYCACQPRFDVGQDSLTHLSASNDSVTYVMERSAITLWSTLWFGLRFVATPEGDVGLPVDTVNFRCLLQEFLSANPFPMMSTLGAIGAVKSPMRSFAEYPAAERQARRASKVRMLDRSMRWRLIHTAGQGERRYQNRDSFHSSHHFHAERHDEGRELRASLSIDWFDDSCHVHRVWTVLLAVFRFVLLQ